MKNSSRRWTAVTGIATVVLMGGLSVACSSTGHRPEHAQATVETVVPGTATQTETQTTVATSVETDTQTSTQTVTVTPTRQQQEQQRNSGPGTPGRPG